MSFDEAQMQKAIIVGDLALWVMLRVPGCPQAVAIDAAEQVVARQVGRTFTYPHEYVDLYVEAAMIATEQMGI